MSENQVTTIIAENNLPEEEGKLIQSGFSSFETTIEQWKDKALSIVVTDESQKELIAQAKEGKKILQEARKQITETHRSLKEVSLRKTQALDAVKRYYLALIEPLEKHLEAQAKFAEIQEANRKAAKLNERKIKLGVFLSPEQMTIYNLELMSDEDFDKLLKTSEAQIKAEHEAREKAEQDRLAKEMAEKETNRRLNLMNNLKSLVDTFKIDTTDIDFSGLAEIFLPAEFDKKFNNIKLIVDERVKAIQAENEKLKKQAEEDRAAKEKAEKELADKKAAEEKAKRDADNAAKEKEVEAKRVAEEAQKAPDKEKLRKFASALLSINYPEMQSEKGKQVIAGVVELMKKVNVYIVENVDKL